MRYALYFTPPISEALTRVAAGWLGRNPFSGDAVKRPAAGDLTAEEIARHTEAPRRYGFHATLKAPFHLAPGRSEGELLTAIMAFCGALSPVALSPLEIVRIGPFFALTPRAPGDALQDFANAVVRRFEPFRAPLSAADLERRKAGRLSRRQMEYLGRWGYPYVFEEFRFHMTLTGPVEDGEAEKVERALHDVFAPVLDDPVEIASLALFKEPARGDPFHVDSLHPLGRIAHGRKGARLIAANREQTC